MAKIAALESELAPLRSQRQSAPAGIDLNQLRQGLMRNPIGVLEQLGVPIEAIGPHVVAHQMGDKAPPALQALVSRGPMMAGMDALSQEVAALRQWQATLSESTQRAGLAQSFKTLSADKSKYPHLAVAHAADPALFEEDVAGHKGDAAALASKIEARLSGLAKVFSPPASTENAEAQSATSEQARAQSSVVTHQGGNPPPVHQASTTGAPSDADLRALRDEVVRGVDAGRYSK